jgi:hypothetical protein
MPVKRRLHKGRPHRITEDAIAAWRAGDYLWLHRALGLHPAQPSPLPLEIEPLGCDQRTEDEDAAMPRANRLWSPLWPEVQALQRQLLQMAGAPDRAH